MNIVVVAVPHGDHGRECGTVNELQKGGGAAGCKALACVNLGVGQVQSSSFGNSERSSKLL